MVTGVRNNDGYREILGARIADTEDERFWSGFFDELKDRGLSGVELVTSDGHKGIRKAVQPSFLGASWQMCQVHFCRAVLKNIPNKDKHTIAEKLKEGLEDEIKMQKLANELNEKGYKKSADTIDRFSQDLWNYKAFPKSHLKRIRTTNGLERINIGAEKMKQSCGSISE